MPLARTSTLLQRLSRVREAIRAEGLDALVVTCLTNVRYLTNHAGTAGVLVLTNEDAHLLVDPRYRESVQLLQHSPAACPGLQTRAVPGSYDEALVGCLKEIGAPNVGFEAAHLTVARHAWIRGALDPSSMRVALHPTERIVEKQRVIKDDEEIAALRTAASRLSSVADHAFAVIRAGLTERQMAAEIEQSLRAQGFERPAFDTIVASGPHSALPHHRAGDRVLTTGDLVVLDFGGVYDGYCSDLTRTVSIGPPSAEASRVYAAVHDAQQAAIEAVAPGVSTSTIDGAARTLLELRGLGEAFGHGTGHGLGLDVHEEPRISRDRPDTPAIQVQAGMVFTIEPGAYLPGWGGVRIEDDVLVTNEGCEVLTSVPRRLVVGK